MSRVVPVVEREPVEATKRKPLTPKQRRQMLESQDFKCANCGDLLAWEIEGRRVLAPMIDEHLIPLGLSGSNEWRNRQLWCVSCSKKKTRLDVAQIAKAKRQAKLLYAKEPSKRPIRSRGFPKRRSRRTEDK